MLISFPIPLARTESWGGLVEIRSAARETVAAIRACSLSKTSDDAQPAGSRFIHLMRSRLKKRPDRRPPIDNCRAHHGQRIASEAKERAHLRNCVRLLRGTSALKARFDLPTDQHRRCPSMAQDYTSWRNVTGLPFRAPSATISRTSEFCVSAATSPHRLI
jgi:hypothetical protein